MSNKVAAFVGGFIGFGVALVFSEIGIHSWLNFPMLSLTGALVGYGYGKRKKAKEALLNNTDRLEEEKKQRIKWAEEIKKMAKNVLITCKKNVEEYETVIQPTFNANAQMDEILKELSNASELKGKVEAMAHDTKTKGGEAR